MVLAISKVAINILGRSNIWGILRAFSRSRALSMSRSFFPNEKKATSDPETMAEINSRVRQMIANTIKLVGLSYIGAAAVPEEVAVGYKRLNLGSLRYALKRTCQTRIAGHIRVRTWVTRTLLCFGYPHEVSH